MTSKALRKWHGPIRYALFFGLGVIGLATSNNIIFFAAPIVAGLVSLGMTIWTSELEAVEQRRQAQET